jgi:hypothetical protein
MQAYVMAASAVPPPLLSAGLSCCRVLAIVQKLCMLMLQTWVHASCMLNI